MVVVTLGAALAAGTGQLCIAAASGVTRPGQKAESAVEQTIEELIELVREDYVLPERVPAIERRLRAGLTNGEYRRLADPFELSARLTEDLRDASGDLHFGIRPHPERRAAGPGQGAEAPDTGRREPAAAPSGGLGRVKLLAGNVGFLEVQAFPDPRLGAQAADAAFAELANSDALILDLRGSRGGHPAMVAYLFSYFFDRGPFLFNRFHWRNSGETLEFWTRDDLASPRYADRQLFVLTSASTPSAAEGLSYHLKQFGRALLVGETTAGAAHTVQVSSLGEFQVAIPTGRPVSPVSGGNWEAHGVEPDRAVPAGEALAVAHRLALEGLLAEATDPAARARLEAALRTLPRPAGGPRD